MILDFSQNGVKAVFEITDNKKVLLRQFTRDGVEEIPDKNISLSSIVELQLAGKSHGLAARNINCASDATLLYVNHNYFDTEDGKELDFTLADDECEVVMHYRFYNGIAAVRTWSTVTAKTDIGIEYISSFACATYDFGLDARVYIPHNTNYYEGGWVDSTFAELGIFKTHIGPGKTLTIGNIGSWSSQEYQPTAAVIDGENGIMWQIEHNGTWSWEMAQAYSQHYLLLSGPSERRGAWYKELKAGESFTSVPACLTFGKSFNELIGEMTKYRRKIFKSNKEAAALPVIFNDYMNCLFGNPTTKKLIPIIDRAADVGAEYFCVDAGWYADGDWWNSVGEWKPCDWRFPNGIKEVLDKIRSRGMIPGLWLEIEVMGVACPILDRFDDECFFVRHGKKMIDSQRYQLDFRNEKVLRHVNEVIDRLVNEYGVGYIKCDYNIDTGIGTEINADSFGDGLMQHNAAYLRWIDEIKAKYPSLIIENCSSGGMRMDYASLSHFHLQSITDQTDYLLNATVAANSATGALPEQAAIWSYPLAIGDTDEVAFNMINSMLTRIHLSGNIANLSDEERSEVARGVACYKSLRDKIASFIPFYPTGLNKFTDDFACAGYKSDDECYLAVWRIRGERDSLEIPIECTSAEVIYPEKNECTLAIAENKLTVRLPKAKTAVVIKVK